jgi:hypothetical protein
MKKDVELKSMVFHNRARDVLLSLYKDFKHSAASIDRQGDENVFQQLRCRYAGRLKHQLQSIASEILTSQEPAGSNELNYVLTSLIEDYEKEFFQKTKTL